MIIPLTSFNHLYNKTNPNLQWIYNKENGEKMNATILSIGTELLFGQIVNTNAAYISEKLQLLGINVMYHHTVGDNPNRLREIIETSIEESDIVISTGGLGPTQDDITKEVICDVMGFDLVLEESVLSEMKDFFKKINREMTENNVKQAYVPKEGKVFYNNMGTAPGFAVEKNNKIVMAMPGPPREMKSMFEKFAVPMLEEKSEGFIRYKLLRMFGIGESALETELEDLINEQTDPTLATYAKEGEVALRIASKRNTPEEALKAVDDMIQKVKKIVGKFIYSYDNEELHTVVGKLLMENKVTLSSAESCTGGLFAKRMTDISGISAVFDRGFITYTNEAKVEQLGVSEETLKVHGAVSEETAVEMAIGVKEVSGTDIGVSITGIAGPGGGSDEKPVGLAYICVSIGEDNAVKKILTRDRGREMNRNYFCLSMYSLIFRMIKERYI